MTTTEKAKATTVVYTGHATHKVREIQGSNVLTNCGLTLTGYTVADAPYPTCGRCARKC